MGHDLFLIEPLAYHNAIIFERYGFNYIRGHQEMVRINEEFRPQGEIHGKLSDLSVFRPKMLGKRYEDDHGQFMMVFWVIHFPGFKCTSVLASILTSTLSLIHLGEV